MSKIQKTSSNPNLDEEQKEKATAIGLHSVKNLLGQEHQLSLFNNSIVEDFGKKYGVRVSGKIDRFGIDLTDIQARVMEGILRGFTETNYKGNIEPKNKALLIKDRYAYGQLPSTYKYIEEIPCLRVTQSQILEWAGVNKRSIAEKERAIEAIKHLGITQYCFYYDRLSLDHTGAPEKGPDGKWKKEEVNVVDTLFVIKEIRNKQSGKLEYYEITPSPIFLDQRESYFMLVPYNWREEVRALVGSKKASSYTFLFLIFLRYQYEMKRRSQKEEPRPFTIQWNWEKIAIALRMPESVYKRKKDRALKILNDVYSVAKQLGYLLDYKQESHIDTLILNEEKYTSSKDHYKIKSEIDLSKFSDETIHLFDFFHNEKRKKDSKYKNPIGKVKNSQLQEFDALLKMRSLVEIEQLIIWGFNTKFWCSRLGSPAKLKQNFSEAWIEMQNSQQTNTEDVKIQENKNLVVQFLESKNYKRQSKVKVDLLNSHVEIGNGVHQPICISYKENGFKEMFLNVLRKWNLY